jgi:hypothetical protein
MTMTLDRVVGGPTYAPEVGRAVKVVFKESSGWPRQADEQLAAPDDSQIHELLDEVSLGSVEDRIFRRALSDPVMYLPLAGLVLAARCPNRGVREEFYQKVVTTFATINEGQAGNTTYYQLVARRDMGTLRHGGLAPSEITEARVVTTLHSTLRPPMAVEITTNKLVGRPRLSVQLLRSGITTVSPASEGRIAPEMVTDEMAAALLAGALMSIRTSASSINNAKDEMALEKARWFIGDYPNDGSRVMPTGAEPLEIAARRVLTNPISVLATL